MNTNTSKLVCPCCSYNENSASAKECELCGTSLQGNSLSLLPEERSSSLANRQKLSLEKQISNIEAKNALIASDYSNVSKRSTFKLFCLIILANLLIAGVLGGSYLLWQRWNQPDTGELNPDELADDSVVQLDSQIKIYRTMEQVPSVPEGLFNYGGATCFAALTKYGMNDAINAAYPQFQLRYTEPLNSKPGCSTGIEMLLDSQLSFAQNGRPLQDSEYAKASSRNLTLKQVPVAIDGIVFFVHPQLSLEGLTIDQLKDIFQGKITNWQEVGGPDLPIAVISQDPTVHITINSLLKNGEKLGEDVKIVRDYTTAMREVGNTVGSISYSSAAIARGQQTIRGIGLANSDSTEYVTPFTEDGQVNLKAFRDNSYPLTRRLFVVIRQDGTLEELAGIAYANLLLTTEGQQIIQKAGFVPLYE